VIKAERPAMAAELFEAGRPGDELAIVSLDGRPTTCRSVEQRVFWKVATASGRAHRHGEASEGPPRHLALIDARGASAPERGGEPRAGLLYVEGRLVERLAPGRHV
jgi:hypothetical protein